MRTWIQERDLMLKDLHMLTHHQENRFRRQTQQVNLLLVFRKERTILRPMMSQKSMMACKMQPKNINFQLPSFKTRHQSPRETRMQIDLQCQEKVVHLLE
jgi:hypothetical protein